jgi:hypothetical protein
MNKLKGKLIKQRGQTSLKYRMVQNLELKTFVNICGFDSKRVYAFYNS